MWLWVIKYHKCVWKIIHTAYYHVSNLSLNTVSNLVEMVINHKCTVLSLLDLISNDLKHNILVI